MPNPNFLIIGAAKSGTTSLYVSLRQHPEIYMSSVKEPNFFGHSPDPKGWNGPVLNVSEVKSFEQYLALFDRVRNEKAIGEASSSTFSAFGCDKVRRYLPDARLILILRQPVDASYSAFLHYRRVGIEPESDFYTAYRDTKNRKQKNWSPILRYRRFYASTVQYWLSIFPREQFHFCLTDDLRKDAIGLVQNLYRFLGVDHTFKPDVSRRNSAYRIRSHALRRLLISDVTQQPLARVLRKIVPQPFRSPLKAGLTRWNRARVLSLDPQLRKELTIELMEDILLLQDLIGRDLSHWLE